MKSGISSRISLCGLLIFTGLISHAEIIYGPDARAYFEEVRNRVGDTFVDFEEPDFIAGVLTSATVDGVTLTFTTTQVRWPSTTDVSQPVYLRQASLTQNKTQSLMGTGSGGGGADGQSRYEIVFSEPQGRVGMMRNWNTYSVTRFYNPDGVLLGEHKNTTGSEFVGWLAGGPELDRWVSKVVIDGAFNNGAYQVGETDDLFFGTANPEGEDHGPKLVYGQEAEDRFALYVDVLGDTIEDFNSVANGPLREIQADNGIDVLTLKTTEKRYPKPPIAVDYPVSVIPYGGVTTPSGTNELMGASSNAGYADGQSKYEIAFSRIQHRVGILRHWNTNSITRFYAGDGSLLAEHQNTTSREFVGWIGDPGDESTWVKKVEMDGLEDQGTFQVGRADDLHYGRFLPERRDMEIVEFRVGADNSVNISWTPAQYNHVLEYSFDLLNWETAPGDLEAESYSGVIPELPEEVFWRVLTQKLF